MDGECLCGSVAFEIAAPSRFVVHCHCGKCRRAHGAGFVTWLGIRNEQLIVKKGQELLKEYESSPGAKRYFCSLCGSPMFFRAPRWPGEVHVALAHLTGEPDQLPTSHAFVSDKASWTTICDDLPQLGGPTGTEAL